MKWNCENNVVTDDIINDVEAELKIKFPRDFVAIIKQYDGGYPIPNEITIEGQEEILKEKGEKERREPAPFLMAAVFLGLELWLSLMTGLLLSSGM